MPEIERYEIIVIKLGGSLITDKTRQDVIHERVMENLAALLARHVRSVREQMIVVLGGGAIGHFAARQLRVDEGVPHCDLIGLQSMASKMYTLKSGFANRLGSHGVAALAFQETSYVVARANGDIALDDTALRLALKLRIVPILSGGLVFDVARGVRPLDGDVLPLALDPSVFDIRRVIMLTDVPGVIATDGTVLTHVDAESRARIAHLNRSPGRVDVTGGMRSKVDVSLALAERGIPSVICSGRDLDETRLRNLVSGTPDDCSLVGFARPERTAPQLACNDPGDRTSTDSSTQ